MLSGLLREGAVCLNAIPNVAILYWAMVFGEVGMRSTFVIIAIAGLALAACTPKKEAPTDTAATPAAPSAPAPADPNKPSVDGEASITSPPSTAAGTSIDVKWT